MNKEVHNKLIWSDPIVSNYFLYQPSRRVVENPDSFYVTNAISRAMRNIDLLDPHFAMDTKIEQTRIDFRSYWFDGGKRRINLAISDEIAECLDLDIRTVNELKNTNKQLEKKLEDINFLLEEASLWEHIKLWWSNRRKITI